MARCLAILVGLTVLLAAGTVHGLWTGRWSNSTELEQAARRVGALPDDLGPWKGEPLEQDSDTLKVAGAVGYWGRRFVRADTGQSAQVFLMCGRPGQMAVHRPEDCYSASGFVLGAPALRFKAQVPGQGPAEMWTGLFTKETVRGPVQLRICWAWASSAASPLDAQGAWTAPASARWAFAREKALYKLYVVREVHGPPGPLIDDECVLLLADLLPVLNRALFGARSSS